MWGSAAAAWTGSSGGGRGGGGRSWQQPRESRGFRWMWACVRPRHRATSVRCLTGPCCRMTRLCCSRDKDKLQPLGNISRFFFFSHSHRFSTLLLLLLFFHIGCSPNVCHTKGRWRGGRVSENILGGEKLPLAAHRSGSVFYHGTCLMSPHGQQTPLPQTNPKKLTKKRILS